MRKSWLQTTVLGSVAISLTLAVYRLYRENNRLKRQLSSESTADPDEQSSNLQRDFTMHEIGVVRSPFPQRAGCPRQGTLAPHVTSHIVLHSHMTHEMLDGIASYSHVWVVFSFHLNSRGKAKQSSNRRSTSFTAAKVRPPRAGGQKLGVLATRAPHRPNPVGLSLASFDSVETVRIRGKKRTCLVLRGLDLVDNTPVYDIKPYVTWDSVERSKLRVPSWVAADDELASVTWSEKARMSLASAQSVLAPLYDCSDQGILDASLAIDEIVAQDPRALHDGRGRTSGSEFEFTFGGLRVSFMVEEGGSARIEDVIVDEGDISASKGSYPYNLALRRQAEMEAIERGEKAPVWLCPVHEGDTESVLQLHDGTSWK